MKKDTKNRDHFIDLIKTFAIITIILWHFGIISTKYFIWAIPAFVFSTAALYENKWKEIKIKNAAKKIIWTLGLVIFFTILLYFININSPNINILDYFKNFFHYFFLRNPQLGNLWYFLLYFQILILVLILSFIFKNYNKIKLEKWYFGIIALCLSLGFSYLLLVTIGRGISFNVVSWAFIIWLGLFNYSKIKKSLSKFSNLSLILFFIVPIILIIISFYLFGNTLNLFVEKYTHDFIFPTLIFQLLYLLSFFSLFILLIRLTENKCKPLLYSIALIGQYSLYIYLLHYFLYNLIFYPLFGIILGFILTILLCLVLGVVLEKIRGIILK